MFWAAAPKQSSVKQSTEQCSKSSCRESVSKFLPWRRLWYTSSSDILQRVGCSSKAAMTAILVDEEYSESRKTDKKGSSETLKS